MKFSDALRLADQLELPDLRGSFIQVKVSKWGGDKPPCCAIGGANIASGLVVIDTFRDVTTYTRKGKEIIEKYVFLTYNSKLSRADHWFNSEKIVFCMICERLSIPRDRFDLIGLVVHLYDNHLLSRTLVADYFDTHHSDNMIDLQI